MSPFFLFYQKPRPAAPGQVERLVIRLEESFFWILRKYECLVLLIEADQTRTDAFTWLRQNAYANRLQFWFESRKQQQARC